MYQRIMILFNVLHYELTGGIELILSTTAHLHTIDLRLRNRPKVPPVEITPKWAIV